MEENVLDGPTEFNIKAWVQSMFCMYSVCFLFLCSTFVTNRNTQILPHTVSDMKVNRNTVAQFFDSSSPAWGTVLYEPRCNEVFSQVLYNSNFLLFALFIIHTFHFF